VHIAFTAADAEAVRAFFKAATEAGAEVLHEPRLWPEYHESYFGAFVKQRRGGVSHRRLDGLTPLVNDHVHK